MISYPALCKFKQQYVLSVLQKGYVSQVKIQITDYRCLCIPQLRRECSSINRKAEQTYQRREDPGRMPLLQVS